VYLTVVLMLRSPPGSGSAQQLCDLLSIPARTLTRWRRWWRQDFPTTPFWRSMRERFMPPVVTDGLPSSVLERFVSESMSDRLTHVLRWISPLSTRMPIR
jgi:hypothetical protein